jgi:hypothetical protein
MNGRQLSAAAALMLGAVAAYALPTAVQLESMPWPNISRLMDMGPDTGGVLEMVLAVLGVGGYVLARRPR